MTQKPNFLAYLVIFGVGLHLIALSQLSPSFKGSIITDGTNPGEKTYYEDFSDLNTVDADAGATTLLDETVISSNQLIPALDSSTSTSTTDYSTAGSYTYDGNEIVVSSGKAKLKTLPTWTEDQIAYYDFNESGWSGTTNEIINQIDANHHMTAAGPTTVSNGKIGRAGEFNGVNDSIIDQTGEDMINGLSSFTISLWVKSNENNSDKGILIAKDPDGSDNVFSLRYDAVGTSGGAAKVIKAGITTTLGQQQIESSANAQSLDWQHIVLTWESGSAFNLYLDGTLDTPSFNNAGVGGTITSATKLIIGKGPKDTTSAWNGLIDEVRIYNRALTSTEVTELHQSGEAIYKTAGDEFSTLLSFDQFSVTPGSNNSGDLGFQLSDNGTSWKYWDGSAWSTTTYEGNSESVINQNIGTFTSATNKIYVKSILLPKTPSDPVNPGEDPYAVLTIHGDETGTNFVDSSNNPHTLTYEGNPTQSVSESKFGGSSIRLDGNGDRIITDTSSNWDLSQEDFTIDLWVFPIDAFNGMGLFSVSDDNINAGVYAKWTSTTSMSIEAQTGATKGIATFSTAPPLNTWSHIAFVRKNNLIYGFLNGTLVGADVLDTSIDYDATYRTYIGSYRSSFPYQRYNGYIDEFHIAKGSAQWTENFTTPTSAYITAPAPKEVSIDQIEIQANIEVLPTSATEILGPITAQTQFSSFQANISNEVSGSQYLEFRILNSTFNPLSINGGTIFTSSDLPLDLTSIGNGSIYLETTFVSPGGTNTNSAQLNNFTITYLDAVCGNGEVESNETCDDGNTNDSDGCSANCSTVETGWSCSGSPSVCQNYGNGVIEGTEECDDGNLFDFDGCSAPGLIDANWTCDQSPSICQLYGNGIIEGTEICDDNNTNSGDGCVSPGLVESGWACNSDAPSVCHRFGNGTIEGYEECDDGNTLQNDGCTIPGTIEEGWTCEQDQEGLSVCTRDEDILAQEEAEAELVQVEVETAENTAAGKAATRVAGSDRDAPPLTIEEANQSIAPQIVTDEDGNVQIIPGKMSTAELVERQQSRPPKRSIPAALAQYLGEVKPSAPPLPSALTELKAPARSLGKDFSAANATLARRALQKEREEKFQKEMDKLDEAIEEAKQEKAEAEKELAQALEDFFLEEDPKEKEEEAEEEIELEFVPVSVETISSAPIVAEETTTLNMEEGGSLELTSPPVSGEQTTQEIKLDIPQGLILGDNQDIEIKAQTLDLGLNPTTAKTDSAKEKHMVGSVLSLSAQTKTEEITEFDQAITLTMGFDPKTIEGMDLKTLRIHYLDETTNTWIPLPKGRVNPHTNTVTGETDHFSFFTVLGDLLSSVTQSDYLKYKSSIAPKSSNFQQLRKKQKKAQETKKKSHYAATPSETKTTKEPLKSAPPALSIRSERDITLARQKAQLKKDKLERLERAKRLAGAQTFDKLSRKYQYKAPSTFKASAIEEKPKARPNRIRRRITSRKIQDADKTLSEQIEAHNNLEKK